MTPAPAASNGLHMDDVRDQMTPMEQQIFDRILYPDDSYNENGVYWADLPMAKQMKWVFSYDRQEVGREWADVWVMFKTNPLSPFAYYVRNMVLPGAGLGLEGYVLFSIGNLKPLFESSFSACWKQGIVCDRTWLAAVEYLEICGIIVGQILVGILGDWLGRRWGLIQDAVVMFLGLIMLTAAWGLTQNGWVVCYVWSLFFYGIGVGGEYPMTATSGMENAVGSGKVSSRQDRLHRGRKVISAFLMQGWGQLFNQVVLIILLLFFHHGSGKPPYSTVAAQWTYRISFAIPAVGTLWLLYYRTYQMKFAGEQLRAAKKKTNVTGYDTESLRLTFSYFGSRMIATAGAWFANDVFFYGNKLFQNEFIKVITDNSSSIMPGWLYGLVNVGVSLVGYYLASFLIDNKLYGRKRMQMVGFAMDFILFIIPAFNFEYFTSAEHIVGFQAMYFLSSFFNQFGPNAVTFLVAAEVYPTPIRATAHGFSAACGKLGALTAAVMYNYISTSQKFYVLPWFGLAGMLITLVFLPDTTGLDLQEQERRWQCIRAGREADYHGVAVHRKHLSWYECAIGVGRFYHPDQDYRQKMEDLRKEWEHSRTQQAEEEEKGRWEDEDDGNKRHWPSEVSKFMEKMSRAAGRTRNFT